MTANEAKDSDSDNVTALPTHNFTYEVKDKDGNVTDTLTFRPLSEIPTGILRRARRDPEEQLWGPFEWALDEKGLAVLDTLPANELPKILEAWQKHSEIELGEFGKSTTSPVAGAPAGRSKPTSLTRA